MKAQVLGALARLKVLGPTYRAYETLRSLRPGADGQTQAPDGLPVPPARLRVRVAGTAGLDWYLDSGRLAYETLGAAVERVGVRMDDFGSVLDFGCGSGRVIRYFHGRGGEIHGADFDAKAIEWCRRNLPFARFVVNDLAPPLPFDDGGLDFVYALSVFTHLPVDLQFAWMNELVRILRPGGLLLITTHGDRYLERLSPPERAQFQRGEVVVRFEQVAGTNLCTTFHPRSYVTDELASGLDLVELLPEGAKGNPHQDLFLLRKPNAQR